MISSLTKSDMDFERRKVVAHLINHSIRNIENKHQRCFEGAAIYKRFGNLLKPYLSCRGVIYCNGSYMDGEVEFEFGASRTSFVIHTSVNDEFFQARWIDFMFIHHIPFSPLKDLFILADGKLFAYRACRLDITHDD